MILRTMEEVDNIIIHSLRQIGCHIEDDITNLAGFNTELIMEATARCLNIIKPGLELSTVLPVNVAARFRLGATLAQACSDLGYRGDIGYQTFLYSSEADLRKVFMFLMEKLPRESDKTLNKPISKMAFLKCAITSVISQSISTPWLPYYCHNQGFRNRGRSSIPYVSVNIEIPTAQRGEEYQDYFMNYQQSVLDQTQNQISFLPSLLSYNAKSIHSRSMSLIEHINWLNNQQRERAVHSNALEVKIMNRISARNAEKSSNEPQVKEDFASQPMLPENKPLNKKQQQELEVEKMRGECETLLASVNELKQSITELTGNVYKAKTTYKKAEKELTNTEEEKEFVARMYFLAQHGEMGIKKLEAENDILKSKLLKLANKFEEERVPLIQKYRQEREKYATKSAIQEKIKSLKEKERELQEECQNKDQQHSQLVAEVQKLPKEVNRSAYTQRILEIINNVRKQRNEINKALADTREIQKEINTLTGRLERSFTVVDELIFRDARTNEASRKAYKLLATLHSDCSEIVALVEETGATIREIRDLEEQIDSESTKNVGANLERITADLKQMKQETAALTAQLQSKAS